MIEETRAYFSVFSETSQGGRSLNALAESLDCLLAAYHRAPDAFDEQAPDPPIREGVSDYNRMRAMVSKAFPELAFYQVVDPIAGIEQEVLMSDAVDDLADIALDLQIVLWAWEHTSPENAAWHFRFGYETHWGRHLHDVRRYIYAKLF